MNTSHLTTPAVLVDRAVVARNCERMLAKAKASGVRLRPHVKTHKTMEIGRMQLGGERGAITVSTVAEAEAFAAAGFDDITYAVPVAPGKLDRCASLQARSTLNLLIDHPSALDAIEEFARSQRVIFNVFLKVDCGYLRAGVDPNDPESARFARRIAQSRAVRFVGLLTHAGHSYHAMSVAEIRRIAQQETGAVKRFGEQLRAAGIRDLIRSVGATPTASVVERFVDCDEVRPGNYVFYDAFQATIGSCTLADCAMSVLTSVIGCYPEQNRLVVDAGALALSKDAGPDHIDPDFGYGIVCDEKLQPLPMKLTTLSQEHGQIFSEGMIDFGTYRVGTNLRVIPNHSCLTAAMFDRYHVIEDGEIVDEWKPVRGW